MKFNFTWKIWLLIFVLILSLISISGIPLTFLEKGVLIKSVDSNSTAFNQGLRTGQIITAIDGKSISNIEDYRNSLQGKFVSNQSSKIIITTKTTEVILYTNKAPEITVTNIPKTNIKTGLDLSGGARALVQAKDKKLSSSEVSDLVAVINNRLNAYGISDMKIAPVSDLSGNNFVLIELAGATPKDLEELVSKQGKFEAKIGNDTVFTGGDKDISSVCRNDATCAGIESCQPTDQGYYCNFRFVVYLTETAAVRHANITSQLDVNTSSSGAYLSKKLDLFLDDKQVDSLLISEGLKGRVTTQIQISGSGSGTTRDDAYKSATESMHKLQTVLITGSLPYQLEIVKLDSISPLLGKEFINSILLASLVAILAVALIVFLKYRHIKTSLAVMFTCLSEVVVILGIASFIDWNIDLPSIAGILGAIGTGVDDRIVLLDESRYGEKSLSIKEKLKRAFSIILGAYFTVVVSLLPLMWAGAGLLKGFAITTLIGISAGVFITRPAFSDMIKKLEA